MAKPEDILLFKKLLELQKALAVVHADAKGDGYKYASGEQVLGIARPKMDELGLLLLQEVVGSEHEHVLWKVRSGEKQQTFVHMKFKFTWIDTATGERLEQLFEADGFNSWDKAAGSAMTYGERYFFMKAFHIPTDEMDPNQRNEKEGTISTPKETKVDKTDGQKRQLIAEWIMEMNGGEKEVALDHLEAITTFEINGEKVPGVRKTSELSDKRLNATYGKTKSMHEEWKKGTQ